MTPADVSHVRWLAGGTGSGKTTLARILAGRYGISVYDGDAAERRYLARCTPREQPRLLALAAMSPRQRWLDRSPREIFETMASLHRETFGFVLGDLLASDPSAPLIVDDFCTLPRDAAPLLSWPGQAVFVIPTPQFRRAALTARYRDSARAGASWGDLDPAAVLEARLARDALWDSEVSRQARELGLPVLRIDGSQTPDELVSDLARRFRLLANGGGAGI